MLKSSHQRKIERTVSRCDIKEGKDLKVIIFDCIEFNKNVCTPNYFQHDFVFH